MSRSVAKDGRKTSEFWLTVGAQAIAAAAVGFGQLSPNEGVQIASIVAGAATSVLSLLGYQGSRARIKSAVEAVQMVQDMIARARRVR